MLLPMTVGDDASMPSITSRTTSTSLCWFSPVAHFCAILAQTNRCILYYHFRILSLSSFFSIISAISRSQIPQTNDAFRAGRVSPINHGVEIDEEDDVFVASREQVVNTRMGNFHRRNSLDTWAELKRIEMNNKIEGDPQAYTDVEPGFEPALLSDQFNGGGDFGSARGSPAAAAFGPRGTNHTPQLQQKSPSGGDPAAPMRKKALAVFHLFDVDDSGDITVEEMAELIKTIAATTPGALADLGGIDHFKPGVIAEMMQLTLGTQGAPGAPSLTRTEFVEKCLSGVGLLADIVGRCDMSVVSQKIETSKNGARDKAMVIFQLFDVDNSGQMDVDELTEMLMSMGESDPDFDLDGPDVEMPPDMLAEMLMMEVDEDGSGGISLEEFVGQSGEPGMLKEMIEMTDLSLLKVVSYREVSDKAMAIFHMFDADKSGGMSPVEMGTMINAIAQAANNEEVASMTLQELTRLLQTEIEAANTGVGDVSGDDFVAACSKRGLLAKLVDDAVLTTLVASPLARKAVEIFKMFDADGNGTLDIDELAAMIKVLANAGDKAAAAELNGLEPAVLAGIASLEFDEDGDGFVDQQEFIVGCTNEGSLLADLVQAADLRLLMDE